MSKIGDEVETKVNIAIAGIRLKDVDRYSATLEVNGRSFTLSINDELVITRPVRARAVITALGYGEGYE